MATSLGPNVAGTWYPGDPDRLTSVLESYLREAPDPASPRGRVVGLVEPHAGYTYSGPVAATGFRLVRDGAYRRVILVGPSHYSGFQGAALPDADRYTTPLGDVPVDRAAVDALGTRPGFLRSDEPFSREHSLEMEIPFLQHVLEPGWTLLPVLLGFDAFGETGVSIADGLRPFVTPDTLVVASSDFTHYGRSFQFTPFRTQVPEKVRDLDLGAVRHIEAMDADAFESYVGSTGATICGRNAISTLIRIMPEGTGASLVHYDTSGRMTGDWSHTVSYATVAFVTGGESGTGD
jgi:AmmeMemoRadiSam system protein B